MKELLFVLLIITIVGCSKTECELAKEKAIQDFNRSLYTFHSLEDLPVENTYRHILHKDYHINWRFIDQDSLKYYGCYDSILKGSLMKIYGQKFLNQAIAKADSLDRLPNWNEEPKFPGGQEALFRFIRDRLQITLSDTQLPEPRRLWITFSVDKTGKVINPVVRRGVNKSLDSTIIGILNKMPNWSPGYQFGQPIKKNLTLPIIVEFDITRFR